MKILVTGSEGFIGKHLVARLVNEGHDVTRFDIANGTDQDVTLPIEVLEATEDHDAIFHLAAAHLVASIDNPLHDALVNAGGAINVLEAAAEHGCKLIMASTGSVHPQDDGIPGTPYGISKGAAETYAAHFASQWDVDVTVLRYFSVYGPGMPSKDRGVIGIFCRAALEGNHMWVEGGSQQRAFCYVDDVVEANMMALHGLPEMIYEVGTANMVSIQSLAQGIKDQYGGGPIVYNPARPGDDVRMVADTKALRDAGWSPKVPLYDGIDRVYQWLSSTNNSP